MTDRTSAFDALAAASAAMLEQHHPADVLVQLVHDCAGPLAADSAAILVVQPGGDLGLLTATSHSAAQNELLQMQQSLGPCTDAVRSGEHVYAIGEDVLVQRWAEIGEAIRDAGFTSVHAFPMHWHGRVLGGLNIFRVHDDGGAVDDTVAIGQAFADVATLALVQVTDLPVDQLAARVQETMAARSVIEQAKGVLAYLLGIDLEAAYQELGVLARSEGASLTETALRVVREQHM